MVSEKLVIKLYDKEIINEISKNTGLSTRYIEENEQKRENLNILNSGYYSSLKNSDKIFIEQSNIIQDIAQKESCVIIVRCADFILKDNIFNIFIYNSEEGKINRAINRYLFDKKKAKKEINRINKLRSNYYKYYTKKEWRNKENYDVCINSDSLGVEKAADIICQMIMSK